jgi:hypothetical protein
MLLSSANFHQFSFQTMYLCSHISYFPVHWDGTYSRFDNNEHSNIRCTVRVDYFPNEKIYFLTNRRCKLFADLCACSKFTAVLRSASSPVSCYWSSSAQSFLVSCSFGNCVHIIFFLTRFTRVLKWYLLFNKRTGLTTTGHSSSTGE